MQDTFNLSGDFRDGVQYFKCTFQLPADEQQNYEKLLKKAAALLATLPIDIVPKVSTLPIGSRLSLSHNPLFVGREKDLKALARVMLEGGEAAVGQLVAAMGLGGIGKTQLASEFCHRYGCYFAGGVYWISFVDPDVVPAEIARCGGREGMNLTEEFDNQPIEHQLQAVLNAWHSPMPRLLVFDNCEDPTLIARWRPRTGGCRIIITSRRDRWAPSLGVQPLALGVLSPAESCALLTQYRPDLQDDRHLAAISETLGYLPLALHLAGSYLGRYPHSPLGDPASYLEKLQDPELLTHRSLCGSNGFSPTEHEQHVGKTFALSWDQLNPVDATDVIALNMLSEAAVLAPGESIPRELLLGIFQPEEVDEDVLIAQEEAMLRIQALGLMQTESDGSLTMHRLVSLFVQHQASDWDAVCTRVEFHLGHQANEILQEELLTPLLRWRYHLKHLAEQAEIRGSKLAGELWNRWGYYLKMAGDYAGAKEALNRALRIDETAFGLEHPDVARDVSNLGLVLREIGDLDGALAAFERALEIIEASYGLDHPKVAVYVNNLGLVHHDLGYLAQAQAAFERALEIVEATYGADHPRTSVIISNLGSVLHGLDDLAGARSAYERALAIDEAVFGLEHPKVSMIINNLGLVLKDLGDLEGARAAFERALGIDEVAYGPEHPTVAICVNNLGSVLRDLGDLEGARAAHERALGIDEATFGPEHSNVARDANNLGSVLYALGDLPGARRAYERARGIDEVIYGAKHPKVATVLTNLGLVLKDLGDLEGARGTHERALAIDEAVYGPDHSVVARDLNNLGMVLETLGDLEGAHLAHKQALGIAEKVYGPDNPIVITYLNNFAWVLKAQGDLLGARVAYERAMELSKTFLGSDHPKTQVIADNLGGLEN